MPENHAPPGTGGDPPAITAPAGTLRAADIARIFSEERAKNKVGSPPVRVTTVWAYLKESRPMVGQTPGRYATNPMPAPDGYSGAGKKGPWWKDTRAGELRDWWNSRPGHGHGTGGRYAGRRASETAVKP